MFLDPNRLHLYTDDFRRTAVRNLIRAGVAERVAMQLVGWKSRQLLDRYHIGSGADLIEAAKKLDAVAAVVASEGTTGSRRVGESG